MIQQATSEAFFHIGLSMLNILWPLYPAGFYTATVHIMHPEKFRLLLLYTSLLFFATLISAIQNKASEFKCKG